MSGLNLFTKFKLQFSPGPVKDRAKDFGDRYLYGAGAFIMRAARSSLRRGKKPATPGKPPHTHGPQSPLKYGIFFAVEPALVVVGPVVFKRGEKGWRVGKRRVVLQSDKTAPQLLEEGGEVRAAVTTGRRIRVGEGRTEQTKMETVVKVRMRYRAFPFMKPARVKGLADYHRKLGFDAASSAIVATP